MKQILIFFCTILLFACNHKNEAGHFTVEGNIKNISDQKVYLDQLYFSKQPPTTIDTAEIKNGKFILHGVAPEQGLFRIRTTESESGYLFVNDISDIKFETDFKSKDLGTPNFSSPANASFKKLFTMLDEKQRAIGLLENPISDTKDSANLLAQQNKLDSLKTDYKNFLLNYVDTTNSPVVAIFALGYSNRINPVDVLKTVNGLPKRFPDHLVLNQLVKNYVAMMSAQSKVGEKPITSAIAPDITLPDTSGKPFSLSSLKGKYVLVDFWASWCGPCRAENPNVVEAYNKFKSKNFTILGVSLDKERGPWLDAIKNDGLTWNHISDLKFWNSQAVSLFNFDAIPYNVLIDPSGKIIAKELRGSDLQATLANVLK